MPINITVDPPTFNLDIKVELEEEDIASLRFFNNSLSSSMRDMANEARDFWLSEAGRRLKTSRAVYQQAITVGTISTDGFSLSLDGAFPYLLEMGSGPYNMNVQRGQIVPLNVNRDVPFTNPTVFRTGTGEPWTHPGFSGLNMSDDVVDELYNNILPKHLDKALEEL